MFQQQYPQHPHPPRPSSLVTSGSNSTLDFPEDDELMVDDLPSSSGGGIAEPNMLTVHNVLASASLLLSSPNRLDLDRCCLVLGNSYYNPAEFPALRIDVKGRSRSTYTISLFESGRIQSTGGCRPLEAKKAMMKIGRRLNEKFNLGITLQNFEIQNVLAVFDACTPVNLQEFVATYNGQVDYEPDRFPAARVRIPVPKKKQLGDNNRDDDDVDEERRSTLKLRKLMMGESASEADLMARGGSASGSSGGNGKSGVGSYLVGARSKRPTSSRQKEEKQSKEEAVTANVFSTGKITFTGAKSIASLNYALEKLKPTLGIRTGSIGAPLSPPTMCLSGGLIMPPQNPFAPSSSSSIPLSSSSPFPLHYYQQQQQQAFNPFIQMTMNATPAPVGSVAARAQQLAFQEQQAMEQEQRMRSFRSTPSLQQFSHPLRTT